VGNGAVVSWVPRDRRSYCSKKHKERIAYITKYKESQGCQKCGNKNLKGPQLDFHHRHGEIKKFNISNCSSYSIEKLNNEIKKCDVVCKNCHAILTYELGQHSVAANISAGRISRDSFDIHPQFNFV
jgi:hypothetical protein